MGEGIASIAAKAVIETAAEESIKESGNIIVKVIGAFRPFWDAERKIAEAYVDEVKNSNLSPEAKMLAIYDAEKKFRELKNQSKIAKIAQEVAKENTDFSESSGVDEDWLARYMDSAKFVSNKEVQLIWGNILAKEFEIPGSTPPQVTRILSEITPVYAKAFNTLCDLKSIITTSDGTYIKSSIIIDSNDTFINSLSINFRVLCELKNLGLIEFEPLTGFKTPLSKEKYPELHLVYNDKTAFVFDYPDKAFQTGDITLTDAGNCIANVIKTKKVEGYWDNLINYLTRKSVKMQH